MMTMTWIWHDPKTTVLPVYHKDVFIATTLFCSTVKVVENLSTYYCENMLTELC